MKSILVMCLFFLANYYVYSQDEISSHHSVGEEYGGGIVFYVDNSGKHGLIAQKKDLTMEKVMWGGNGITNATSMTNGQENTQLIVKYMMLYHLNAINDAACGCDILESEGYGDWFLPSIDELQKMYNNQLIIGNFRIGDYCSSTEYGKKDVCCIHFRPHKKIQFYYNKNNKDYYVRCIRKF
jgi:hypothetical protein